MIEVFLIAIIVVIGFFTGFLIGDRTRQNEIRDVSDKAWIWKQNYERVLEEAEEYKDARNENLGEWQLCPKCNGDGNLLRFNSPPMLSTSTDALCDICKGAKMIVKPYPFKIKHIH